MAEHGVGTEKRLDILHDHSKETFERIRDMEKRRDRYFLILIGFYGLLAVQIAYPTEFAGTVTSISILGVELGLTSLPLAAILSATWVFTLAIGLRYCQISIGIDRRYPYLHLLEETISPLVGGGPLYQREGQVYLDRYPLMLNGAWIAYVILFPLLLLIATSAFITVEWIKLDWPRPHVVFDTVVAAALVVFFFLYRFQPYVSDKLANRVLRSASEGTSG
jgi:hypothetical protein